MNTIINGFTVDLFLVPKLKFNVKKKKGDDRMITLKFRGFTHQNMK